MIDIDTDIDIEEGNDDADHPSQQTAESF